MDFSVEEAAAVLIDAVVGDCASTPGLDRVVFCLLRPDAFTAFFRHAVRRSIALETRSFDEPGRSTASVGRGQSGTNSSQLLAERLRNETSRAVRASLIQDALTRLLVPPLSEPVTPRGNDGDEFCKEFAFPNNSPEGFWKTLDERFGASIVRVISPTGEGFGLDHATELMRKRLRGSPTGRVGLVVVGEMESPTFNRAALEAHRREELLILILDGLDLCQMLELQRTGKRIEPYLEAKVSAFLTSSESGEFVSEVEKPTARRVFVSYAHEDSAHEYMLEKTLRLMHIQGLLTLWHDGRILAGSKWENEICEELDQADIVVCLVSLDFLSSAYCFDKELERALERRSAGAMVVPLVVRPCEWDQTPLAELQAIPHDPNGALVAITQWQDPDLAWHEVAREFRRLLSEGELRS